MLNIYFLNRNEEQVLLYITWTGNARILNMSESQLGQICLDMCNFVNIPEYVWNSTSQIRQIEF